MHSMGHIDANRKYEVRCDCSSHDVFEAHEIIKTGNIKSKGMHTATAAMEADVEQVKATMTDVKGWLPFAAEQYNISAKLEDFVFVPCPIMYNDAPNRNGVGFPYVELTRFNPHVGDLAYRTWKGKPTFMEHVNRDWTKAKGVIADASMRQLEGHQGNFYKVALLLGFDRNVDAVLANQILTKERTSYSMGALCKDYTCSICDKSVNAGGCEHTEVNKPRFKLYNGNELAYLQAIDFIGFECSSVGVPAYYQATNPDYMMV